MSGKQEEMKRQIYAATDVLRNLVDQGTPPIGLDLDGCIDEAPEFFGMLSMVWPGKVFVITYRTDQARAELEVARYGIRCDEVVLVDSFAEKAKVIADRGITVYVDDQDEMLMHIPEGVTVLKIRNGGNYDFEERKWLFSETTGKQI
jgi:hypothetical protein